MKIAEMMVEDVEEIKSLARKAILESVTAEEALKQEIMFVTNRHIDENIGSDKCAFLKCHDENIDGFILIQDFGIYRICSCAPKFTVGGLGSYCSARPNRYARQTRIGGIFA